jgi:hypothetical protein
MFVTLDGFQGDNFWLKLVAPSNMLSLLVTLDTFQRDKSWLNLVAPLNMNAIVPTLEVSHGPIGWSKSIALANMPFIVVSLEVSEAQISWLKAVALRNISSFVVTMDVFQDPIAWSKAAAPENMSFIVVTLDVSHEDTSWLKALASPNLYTSRVSNSEVKQTKDVCISLENKEVPVGFAKLYMTYRECSICFLQRRELNPQCHSFRCQILNVNVWTYKPDAKMVLDTVLRLLHKASHSLFLALFILS